LDVGTGVIRCGRRAVPGGEPGSREPGKRTNDRESPDLFERLHPQNLAVAFVSDQINKPIRPLHHVAQSLPYFFGQQPLLVDDLVAFKFQAHQGAGAEAGDQHIAFPLRVFITGVEQQPGGSEGGHPSVHWLLHAFLVGAYAATDLATDAVLTVSNEGPAVVLTYYIHVAFIDALGAVLAGPELQGLGVQSGILHFAM